jgi:predicted amidohydrolase YtcJ
MSDHRPLSSGAANPGPQRRDLLLHHGLIWPGGAAPDPAAEMDAILIRGGRVRALGRLAEVEDLAGPETTRVDLGGRRVIPGLIDSHIHAIRAGLTYLDELDWTLFRDLTAALDNLRAAARNRLAGEWITALGGWHPTQFRQNRMPTKAELDAAAPQRPVFVHPLYGFEDYGVLNTAGLERLGWVNRCPDPEGGKLARDGSGAPDGRLYGLEAYQHINRTIIQPPLERAVDSTVAFFERLSALGITGIVDAGGLGMRPERYHAVRAARAQGRLPIRVRMNLCATTPGSEAAELEAWRQFTDPGFGDEWLSVLGLGELLLVGSHDWEGMAPFQVSDESFAQLVDICRQGARAGWPHTIHAILDTSITRILDALEEVNKEIPLAPLRWNLCHAECLTEANVARIAELGLGVAFQGRLLHKASVCAQRWGENAVINGPPLGSLIRAGVPIGAGTDSTRGASYNPWHALSWFVTGIPWDGGPRRATEHLLSRADALNAYSSGSAWFSFEERERGHLRPGALADLAVLSADVFAIDEPDIIHLTSDLTICGGHVVHRCDAFDLDLDREAPYPIRDGTTARRQGALR